MKFNLGRFFVLLILIFVSSFAKSADYYWIGGEGNWSDLNHWATASGGNITHLQIPTSEDDVFFDENSFTADGQIVEINGNLAFCRNLDFSNARRNQIFRTNQNNTLNIFGSVTFVPEMISEINGSIQLSGEGLNNTIDFQFAVVQGNFFVEGNGSWTLAGHLNVIGTFFLNRGTLHLDSFTLLCGFFHSHSIAPRALYWEEGTVQVNNGSQDFGSLDNPNNVYSIEIYSENWMSFSSNGTLILPDPRSKIYIISKELWPTDPGGNIVFDDIIVQADFGIFELINRYNQTEIAIRDLRLNHNSNILSEATMRDVYLAPGYRYLLHGDSDFVMNSLFANGSCEAPITLQSASVGQATRITFQEEVNIEYVELGDIHITSGVGNLLNGTDRGNNQGWNIMDRESSDYFWIGDGGLWSSPNHWSLTSGGAPAGCIPSSTDNVFFDQNSFSLDNQSVVINIPDASCKTMDWSGVTNSPILTGDEANNLSISGSLYFDAGMTNDFQGRVSLVGALQGLEVRSAGNVFNTDVYFENPNGQWTVLDDIDIGSALRIINGHIIFDDVNIDVSDFDSQIDTERIIDFKSSVLNLITRGNFGAEARIQMANLTLNSENLIINSYGPAAVIRLYGESSITFKEYNSYANSGYLESYLYGDGNHLSIEKIYFKKSGGLIGEIRMDSLIMTGGNSYDLNDDRTHLFLNELILREPCYGIADIFTEDIFFIGTQAQITFQENRIIDGFSFRDIKANSDFGDVQVIRGVDAGRNLGFNFIDYVSRNLYWIGGEGQWTNPENWSLSSGGLGGECAPISLDNVFFDVNSFDTNQDIVLSDSILNLTCRNFTFDAPETDIRFSGIFMKIYGSLFLERQVRWFVQNMTTDGVGDSQFIRTSGTLMNNIMIQGRAPVELSDDLILFDFRGIEITTTAPFITNGHDIRSSSFSIRIEEGISEVDMSGSTVEITGDASPLYKPIQFFGNSMVALDSVLFRLTGPNSGIYNEGDVYIHNVIFETASGQMHTDNRSELSYSRLDVLGNGLFEGGFATDSLIFYPSKTYIFDAEVAVDIGSYWRARGNNCTPIGITSSGVGFKSQVIIPTEGVVEFDFVEMRDMEAQGGADFNAGPHSTDIQNSNRGWLFPELTEVDGELGFLGKDLVLCGDESTTINAFSNTPNETYIWNNGSMASEIEVSNAGQYSVEVTFLNGCEIMDSINVIEASEVQIQLPNDTVICNEIDFEIDAELGIDNAIYNWSDGSNTPELQINSPGIYKIDVSVGECSASDSFQVDLVTIENLDLGADIMACQGDTILLGFGSNENLNFMWSNDLTTPEILVTEEGLFSVLISSDECEISDEVNVILSPLPVFSLGEDVNICEDSVLLLNAPLLNEEYLWSDGTTTNEIRISNEAKYTLTITDSNGCSFSDEIQIIVHDIPQIQLADDTSFCQGDEVLITFQSNNDSDDLEWLGTGIGALLVSMSGEYVASASNGFCTSFDTITVSELPPPIVNLGGDTTICSSEGFSLNVSQEGADYEWNNGSTDAFLDIINTATYEVTVSIGSCFASDGIFIAVVEGPQVTIEGINEACDGEAIELIAVSGSDSLLWNTGENDASIIVDQSAIYSVQVSDNQGCTFSDSLSVTFGDTPFVDLTSDTVLCDNQQLSIDFPDSDLTYNWSDGIKNHQRNITSSGDYQLTVTNEFGCDYEASIGVVFQECSEFSMYIPDAFAPSSVSGNDKFYISVAENIQITSWSLNLFDRWGNHVFRTLDPNIAWDGKWMNNQLKPGVYVYNLEIEYIDDIGPGKENTSGTITLLE